MKRRRLIVPASSAPPRVASSFAGPADPPAPNVAPRMPSLPSALVYEQSPALVNKILREQVADPPGSLEAVDFEVYTQAIRPSDDEQVIFTSARPWRACDVYLASNIARDPTHTFSVFIYARFAGARFLVSSGRLGEFPLTGFAATDTFDEPTWAAAARAGKVRWEVTLLWGSTGGVPLEPDFLMNVAIVACDDAPDPPVDLGAVWLKNPAGSLTIGNQIGLNASYARAELVEVAAVIDPAVVAADHRYLMLFEGNAAPANGEIPIAEWALGSAHNGEAGVQARPGYRARSSLPGYGLRLRCSSTSAVLTVVADCMISAKVR